MRRITRIGMARIRAAADARIRVVPLLDEMQGGPVVFGEQDRHRPEESCKPFAGLLGKR